MTAYTIPTRVAHWGWHEHQFHGHPVFAEFMGVPSFMRMTVLAALGRDVSAEGMQVIEDAASAMTLSDPRIWPLKLSRLVASFGQSIPGFAAGMLTMQSAAIGPFTCKHTAERLVEFHRVWVDSERDPVAVEQAVLKHLAEPSRLSGFGIPFREVDERFVAFSRSIVQRGRDVLPYWQLMGLVAAQVRAARGLGPNLAMAIAAAFLDLGLSPEPIGHLTTAISQHMFFANAVEGAEQRAPLLRELPLTQIEYVGPEARESPRKS